MNTPPATPSTSRCFRLGLAIIAVLGFVGRLLYLVVSKVDQTDPTAQGDALWYTLTADSLARGNLFQNLFTGAETAEHPPLAVLAFTPASLIRENWTLGQRLTSMLLGTAIIVVVGMIARRLAGPTAGLIAAAAAALLPSLWINDVLIMSETVSALVLALAVWAAVALADRPTVRLAAVAGGLCGLAALGRAEAGLLLPLMVWVILARSPHLDGPARVRALAASTAAAMVVLVPWIGINLVRFEEPVLISTNDGLTLAGANCDATYDGPLLGGWTIVPCAVEGYAEIDGAKPGVAPTGSGTCPDTFQQRPPCLDPSQVSSRLRSHSLTYMRNHLAEIPKVVVARNARVWGVFQPGQAVTAGAGEGRTRAASWAAFGALWLTLPLAVAGLVTLRRRGIGLAPFLAPLAVALLAASAFSGLTPRYRLPWDLVSCVLIGVAIPPLIDRWKSWRSPGVEPPQPA